MLKEIRKLTLGQKKSSFFPGWVKSAGWKPFYHLPAGTVEFVSEHVFLILKNKQTSKRNKNTKKAKETKEEKRLNIWKIDWKNKSAAVRVKIFLVNFFFFFFFTLTEQTQQPNHALS